MHVKPFALWVRGGSDKGTPAVVSVCISASALALSASLAQYILRVKEIDLNNKMFLFLTLTRTCLPSFGIFWYRSTSRETSDF